MSLVAFGLNHQTAPLSLREQLAFPAEQLKDALGGMLRTRAVSEAAILSTCNRTEIYCNAQDVQATLAWVADYRRLPVEHFQPHLYIYDAEHTARHAFRVASGLDSMVLGETQILGQMKDAVRTAEAAGSLGTLLNQLFQRTFAVAKDVRSQTSIGASSVSMAAAAVRLAEQIFGDVNELDVLFIGAGEMIDLVATHFAAHRPRSMTIANRTLERGEALAQRLSARAVRLSDLPDILSRFDVVVTSTASSLPILGKGLAERAIRERRHRPMFMLDLAVPRDVEPEVGDLDDVFLYTVDDIADVVEAGREERRLAAEAAEANLVGVQRVQCSDSHRLLADAKVEKTANLPGAVKLRRFLLQMPDAQHVDEHFLCKWLRPGHRSGGWGRCGVRDRHLTLLRGSTYHLPADPALGP